MIKLDYVPLLITNDRGQQSEISLLSSVGDIKATLSSICGAEGFQTIILPSDDTYTFEPITGDCEIDLMIDLKNGYFRAVSEDAKKVSITSDGTIELQNVDGDYQFGSTFSDDKPYDLPWFTVRPKGNGECDAFLKPVSDGMILTSNNLNNMSVEANNRTAFVKATFSTSYPSVKFMAVDDDTLGVYVDTDGNGEYETLIADSDGTEYSGQQPGSGDKTDNTDKTDTTSNTDNTGKTDNAGKTDNTDTPTPTDSRETSGDAAAVIDEQSLPGESNTEKNTTPVQTSAEPADSPAEERTEVSSEPISSADSSFAPFAAGILAAAVIAAFVIVLLKRKRKE